ncbi:hypothetical protein HPB47_022264 [Ixodes persulcatus]|uniref:Uncharacterized protein n=1 Tax=Ixodes persulcatus TaxID=34615 RepID=A0AC60QC14_IXOPE|nr:hypothetical protein HPB47_022264 [Ixodes persulcatus]
MVRRMKGLFIVAAATVLAALGLRNDFFEGCREREPDAKIQPECVYVSPGWLKSETYRRFAHMTLGNFSYHSGDYYNTVLNVTRAANQDIPDVIAGLGMAVEFTTVRSSCKVTDTPVYSKELCRPTSNKWIFMGNGVEAGLFVEFTTVPGSCKVTDTPVYSKELCLPTSNKSGRDRLDERECGGLIGWFIPRTPLPLRALPGTPSVAVGKRSGAGVTWYLDGDHVVLLSMAGRGGALLNRGQRREATLRRIHTEQKTRVAVDVDAGVVKYEAVTQGHPTAESSRGFSLAAVGSRGAVADENARINAPAAPPRRKRIGHGFGLPPMYGVYGKFHN